MESVKTPVRARGGIWLRAAVLIAVGCWTYAPALNGGWLWDDDITVAANARLRSLAGLGRIWLAPAGVNYFPLTDTVEWVEWHLWGANVLGYHCVNLALHLAGAFLLWRVLERMGARGAWLGGLLFAVHPLCVESVAWISELKNTLALPLLLIALLAWMKAEEGRGGSTPSCLWFLASILCKTSGVMFPVVLFAATWWRRGRVGRSDIRRILPFFAISAGLGLVGLHFEHSRAIEPDVTPLFGLFTRIEASGTAIVFYLGKCLWPFRLIPMYPRWSFAHPAAALLPWTVVVAFSAWLWLQRSRPGRALFCCWGWFVLNLLPVCGLIRMSYWRVGWAADHFAYLSLMGCAAAGGIGLAALLRWAREERRLYALSGAAAAVAALAWAARTYSASFHDQTALCTTTLRRNPSAWLAENDLGYVDQAEGRLEEAIGHYRSAIALNPGSALAHDSLANTLAREGDLTGAVAEYRIALRLRPNYPEAHGNLGNALWALGRKAEALAEFEESVHLRPGSAQARGNLGMALAQSGRLKEAAEQLEEAIQLEPASAILHLNLGNVCYLEGKKDEAAQQYLLALRLDPTNPAVKDSLERLRR